jgi:hypothetical protein
VEAKGQVDRDPTLDFQPLDRRDRPNPEMYHACPPSRYCELAIQLTTICIVSHFEKSATLWRTNIGHRLYPCDQGELCGNSGMLDYCTLVLKE